jgi:ubiquinone/menaquinone biosynthesis C-methylase UbiE
MSRNKQLFDNWPDKYDRWFMTPIGKLVKKYETEALFSLLEPDKGQRILDVGCGSGIFTVDMLSKGAQVVGLDLSFPMIQRAGEKAKFLRTLGDIRYLPFHDGTFDKTVSITAIDFVANAKAAIEELFRITRNGGRIVVATLNSLSSWAVRRRKDAQADHDSLFNNVFFRSPDDLKACVSHEGIVKTAIHFAEDEHPVVAAQIEEQDKCKELDTGAFLLICWEKTI